MEDSHSGGEARGEGEAVLAVLAARQGDLKGIPGGVGGPTVLVTFPVRQVVVFPGWHAGGGLRKRGGQIDGHRHRTRLRVGVLQDKRRADVFREGA